MYDILSAIYRDDPFSCQNPCSLANPTTPEEWAVAIGLHALEPDAARTLEEKICSLTSLQAERAFCDGVRFGARLMVQLLEDLPG